MGIPHVVPIPCNSRTEAPGTMCHTHAGVDDDHYPVPNLSEDGMGESSHDELDSIGPHIGCV